MVRNFQAVIEQRTDKRVFAEFIDIFPHVVPHCKARKGKTCEVDLVQHLPALHVEDLHLDHSQNFGDADARSDIIQPADVDFKFAQQEFEEGVVDLLFVLGKGNGKSFSALAPCYFYRAEYERRIFRLVRIRFVPFEEPERQIQNVGARFLLRRLPFLDEIPENVVDVLRFRIGTKASVFQLYVQQFVEYGEICRHSEIFVYRQHSAHVRRLFQNGKFLA